ncbi:MAG: carboxylate-amine ligase [Solirubrobacteraceae bacterium]
MATIDAPSWARWSEQAAAYPWTVGVEEEVMLLEPGGWSLAHSADEVLPRFGASLAARVGRETHSSALELRTAPHPLVEDLAADLSRVRGELADALSALQLRAAVAGLHPFAVWSDTRVSSGDRYQRLYGSMRELARREPTFALHVHVAVPDPESAVNAMARLSSHLPLLLALSANSPFWQGRDTGLASARTPLFQAFPRVGIPRAFAGYEDYVQAVDLLLRCEAIADPSFLWWDVRLQPSLGTIEVRIMDAQSRVADSAALAALVQVLVHAEARRPPEPESLRYRPEVLTENRFLAARDGMEARLIDAEAGCRRPARELLVDTLALCGDSADELGCSAELERIGSLSEHPGSTRQRVLAQSGDKLPGLVSSLAGAV